MSYDIPVSGPDIPATDYAEIQHNSRTGVVTIYGDHQANSASVKNAARGKVRIELDGKYEECSRNDVTGVVFYGYGGNDFFVNSTNIESAAYGGSGNDLLLGGSANDLLDGGMDNDNLHGNEGSDILLGQSGNDYLAGGSGRDSMWGHTGLDQMFGGAGNDAMYGGADKDWIHGDAGNDKIVSIGGGIDEINGGSQWDYIWMDLTDQMHDASAHETAEGYIHQVDQFFEVSYDGGKTSTPISKELNGQDLPDPTPAGASSGPTAPMLNNFQDNPLFMGTPNLNDVIQGATGNCYFLSRVAALAYKQPEIIRNMVTDLGDGTYAVRFFRDGQAEYVRVDADLWTTPSGLQNARVGSDGEIWGPIIEKAYAMWRTQSGSYESLNNGNESETGHLLGVAKEKISWNDGVTESEIQAWVAAGQPNNAFYRQLSKSVSSWLTEIQNSLAAGKPVVVGHISGASDITTLNSNSFRRGQHVTTVVEVLTDDAGNPSGLRLRDQNAQTNTSYANGYLDMTDFASIYFLFGSAATMSV